MQPQLDPFMGITSIHKVLELQQYLNKQVFSVKDLGIPPKTVTHWDKSGLGVIKRTEEKQWRRLSFMEYLWVQFVNELRDIGVSVPIILKAKEALKVSFDIDWIIEVVEKHPELWDQVSASKEEFETLYSSYGGEVDYFMLLTVSSIVQRTPVSIIVFLDGTILPWFREGNDHWTEELLAKKEFESYVTVPVSGLFTRFLANPRTQFALPKLKLLNESEEYLMEQVHSGKYKSITVNFKDERIKSLELVKEHDVKKRITEVLADASYQDIEIKTHKGMVTKIENTVKVLF